MSLRHNQKIPTNGLQLLLDGASPRSALMRKQSSNILVDPHTWTAGTDGVSGYGRNGDAGEQSRDLRTDPWGGTSMTWRSTPDATSGADGGWNSSYYSIDRNYTYRWSVFVRRYTSGSGGTFYFGLNPAPIRNDNDAVQGNPYWTYPAISNLTLDRWYWVCGHCFYEGYTGGRHPDTGWYEYNNNQWSKISDKSYGNVGTQDVRWNTTTTSSMHRTYHYYTTNTASGVEWAYPRLDKMDGTQPSVWQILKQGEGKWNDLSGNGNDGIIANHQNVTWSPDYGGVFNFDGNTTYSYITCDGPNLSNSDYTIIGASRYTGSTRGRIISAKSNNWLLGHWNSGSDEHYAEGWIRQGSNNDTNWGVYVATGNHSADQRSYWKNGTKVVTNSTAGSAGPNGFMLGRYYANTTEFSQGQLGYLAAYNRVLTDEEIIQVTNSLKRRYGLL